MRFSARDRPLLEALVVREGRELRDLGVEVSLSSDMRKLIRAAARSAAIDAAARVDAESDARGQRPTRRQQLRRKRRAPSRNATCARPRTKTGERRGLGAELALALGVSSSEE